MRFLIKEYQDTTGCHSHKLMAKKKDLNKIKKELLWKEKTTDGFNNFYEYSFPSYIKIVSVLEDNDLSEKAFEICSYCAHSCRKIFSYDSADKSPDDWRDDDFAQKSFAKKVKKLENTGYIYV